MLRFYSLAQDLLNLSLLVLLVGCGSTKTGPAGSSPTVPTASDFALTVTPASTNVTAGGSSVSVSLLATPSNGFTGIVSVSVAGLGAGVSTAPATISLTPGTASTVTLAAIQSTVAASETITFTGTSGTLSHKAALTLNVVAAQAPSDFTIAVSPSSGTITPGGMALSLSLLATPVNGFAGSVSVVVSGLGTGITASPATLSLMPGSAAPINLTAGTAATAGAESITFTATSGALIHTATITLTVASAPAAGDFTLSISPDSGSITSGAAVLPISILATAANGFTGTVNVALSGLGSGVTASPSTLSLAPGTAGSISISAASAVTAGPETIAFTGTSGSLSHTVALALTVVAAGTPPAAGPDVTTYHYGQHAPRLEQQ